MKSKYPKITTSRYPGDTHMVIGNGGPEDAAPYLQSRVDHDGDREPMVRIMKSSPEHMCLQIRTFGCVNSLGRGGVPRPVYSSISFNRQGMLALAAEIERIAKELPEV